MGKPSSETMLKAARWITRQQAVINAPRLVMSETLSLMAAYDAQYDCFWGRVSARVDDHEIIWKPQNMHPALVEAVAAAIDRGEIHAT